MVRYLEERGRNNVHGHQAHPRMRVLQLPFSQHEHPLRRELDRNSLSEASYILSFPVLASTTGVLCTGVNLQLYIMVYTSNPAYTAAVGVNLTVTSTFCLKHTCERASAKLHFRF
ncbi:uncharacterized protein LOC119984450 isoform X2 [Tripterygium wilfordii]|uniref:uncharacterized protein LOC119984450 isoform X2 n=1 Tax=Tripterygium wilfordii TaxID=458696 RepID=UPI0018F85B27|nr:uncharacterized protein LOC119984450 isoform X2 [Tripterygium wilfordii]